MGDPKRGIPSDVVQVKSGIESLTSEPIGKMETKPSDEDLLKRAYAVLDSLDIDRLGISSIDFERKIYKQIMNDLPNWEYIIELFQRQDKQYASASYGPQRRSIPWSPVVEKIVDALRNESSEAVQRRMLGYIKQGFLIGRSSQLGENVRRQVLE